jgi:hypothetical protein
LPIEARFRTVTEKAVVALGMGCALAASIGVLITDLAGSARIRSRRACVMQTLLGPIAERAVVALRVRNALHAGVVVLDARLSGGARSDAGAANSVPARLKPVAKQAVVAFDIQIAWTADDASARTAIVPRMVQQVRFVCGSRDRQRHGVVRIARRHVTQRDDFVAMDGRRIGQQSNPGP